MTISILFRMNNGSVDSDLESTTLWVVGVVFLGHFLARNSDFFGTEFVQNLSLRTIESFSIDEKYLEMLKFWTMVSYTTELNMN